MRRFICWRVRFIDEGDEVLLCTPSFFMYDVSCSMMTSKLVRVQADDSFAFPMENFLAAITPRTKLIMIATPNNPTGQIVSLGAGVGDLRGGAAGRGDGG